MFKKQSGRFRKHYQSHVTATHLYRGLLLKYCSKDTPVLDFGAGKGINNRLIPDGITIYGVDTHPSILENNRLTERQQIIDSKIPYAENSFGSERQEFIRFIPA